MLPWLEQCTALTDLRLTNVCTQFEEIDSSRFFAAIPQVKNLEFGKNTLNDRSITEAIGISMCTNLVSLDLSWNSMTNASVEILKTRLTTLRQLTLLDISGNRMISDEAVATLRTALPSIQVLFDAN